MRDLTTSTYITKNDVSELRRKCMAYGLENAGILDKYSDEQITRMYNDFGPSELAGWIEDIVSSASPFLGPACLVRDIELVESDGTMDSFLDSCRRLRDNGHLIASTRFHWWRPSRYVVMMGASALAKNCIMNGWEAWRMYHDHKGPAEERMSDIDLEIGFSNSLYRACRINLVYSISDSPLVL